MPVTILECAEARGLKRSIDGGSTMQDFWDVGFDLIGGCCVCQATIAAYNAHPTVRGYWCCADCVDGNGFDTVRAFEDWGEDQEAMISDDADAVGY